MPEPIREIQFLHLAKTAGTSLASLIETAFPAEQILPVYEWHDLSGWNRAEINRHRCFHGHFGTGLDRLLDRPMPSITILRDPFEQMVSHLLHAARHEQIPWPAPVQDWLGRRHQPDHPYLELILSRPANRFRDYQTRFLGVDIDPDHPDRKDWTLTQWLYAPENESRMDAILENAKRRLDQVTLVGTVEDFDNTVAQVCQLLGIPVPEDAPWLNAGRAGHQGYRGSGRLSARLETLVDQHTPYDRELIRHATDLMARRRQFSQHAA